MRGCYIDRDSGSWLRINEAGTISEINMIVPLLDSALVEKW